MEMGKEPRAQHSTAHPAAHPAAHCSTAQHRDQTGFIGPAPCLASCFLLLASFLPVLLALSSTLWLFPSKPRIFPCPISSSSPFRLVLGERFSSSPHPSFPGFNSLVLWWFQTSTTSSAALQLTPASPDLAVGSAAATRTRGLVLPRFARDPATAFLRSPL